VKVHNLLIVTINFLELLIILYERRKIQYSTFYECSKQKIKFLEDNITEIASIKKREEARLILNKCNKFNQSSESDFAL